MPKKQRKGASSKSTKAGKDPAVKKHLSNIDYIISDAGKWLGEDEVMLNQVAKLLKSINELEKAQSKEGSAAPPSLWKDGSLDVALLDSAAKRLLDSLKEVGVDVEQFPVKGELSFRVVVRLSVTWLLSFVGSVGDPGEGIRACCH